MARDRLGALDVLGHALRYWRPHTGAAVLLVVLLLLQEGFGAMFAYALKHLIDHAIPARDGDAVLLVVVAVLAGYAIAALATIGSEYVGARTAGLILTELRRRMFVQLQRLSLAYHGRTHSGDLVSRFSGDIGDVEKAVTTRIVDAALAALGLVVYLPFLFALDWRLATLVSVGLPVVVVGGRLFSGRAARARTELRRGESEVVAAVSDNIRAQPVVKLFELAPHAVESFDRILARVCDHYVRSTFLAALVGAISSLGVLLFQVIVIAVGAAMALHGELETGTLVAFVTLQASVSKQAYDLAKKVVPALISAGGGIARIEELLDEQPDVVEAPDAVTSPQAAAPLKLEDVTFAYEPGRPSVSGVSLEIPAGETVALVGPSGSGKSTVLKLLLRFHDPQDGRVLFGEHDVRGLTLESFRAQMGAVFQEPLLVAGSVRDNIRLGKLDATDAEIERAAMDAEIHGAIAAMPDGYATPVGEAGSRLSGGQRQRIAIARALVRSPKMLVLDEATSALDPASEQAIQETLARLSIGRTIISVTHRLASAVRADRIFVFDGGRLVESGTHDSLQAAGGLYAELWRKQSGVELAPQGTAARVRPEWLHEIPLFRKAPDAVLARMADDLVFERLDGARSVFEAGEVGDKFYILARGRVEVVAPGGKRIAVLTDGDFFGEMALLQDTPRSATVRTLAPCSFLTLDRGHFAALMERSPELSTAMRDVLETRQQAPAMEA